MEDWYPGSWTLLISAIKKDTFFIKIVYPSDNVYFVHGTIIGRFSSNSPSDIFK